MYLDTEYNVKMLLILLCCNVGSPMTLARSFTTQELLRGSVPVEAHLCFCICNLQYKCDTCRLFCLACTALFCVFPAYETHATDETCFLAKLTFYL